MRVCERFFFAMDMTGDGQTTISDVMGWLETVFFIPSQIIMWVIDSNATVSNFLETHCTTGTGAGGAIFSGIVWWLVFEIATDDSNKRHS